MPRTCLVGPWPVTSVSTLAQTPETPRTSWNTPDGTRARNHDQLR